MFIPTNLNHFFIKFRDQQTFRYLCPFLTQKILASKCRSIRIKTTKIKIVKDLHNLNTINLNLWIDTMHLTFKANNCQSVTTPSKIIDQGLISTIEFYLIYLT